MRDILPLAVGVDFVKTWLVAHNAAIVTLLFLVLGAKLFGDAIADLSA